MTEINNQDTIQKQVQKLQKQYESLNKSNSIENQQSLQNQKPLLENQEPNKDNQNKRRKKHRKHRHRKHSPEYYERIKQIRANKKKQSQWDNRFYLAEIPEKIQDQHNIKSTKRINILKKQFQLASQKSKGYKTLHGINKRKENKAFNVRVVKPSFHSITNSNNQSISGNYKQKYVSHNNNQAKNQQFNKQEQNIRIQLLENIDDLYAKAKFSECHYQFMKKVVENCIKSKMKNVKNIINIHLAQIKANKMQCVLVEEAIQKRQKCLQKMFEMLNQSKKQKQNEHIIAEFRQLTIHAIEEILRWKDIVQEIYVKNTKIKAVWKYMYKGSNYLLKIAQDLSSIYGQKIDNDDPFLVSYKHEQEDYKIRADQLVKIRACQLLLLEENIVKNNDEEKNQKQKKNQKEKQEKQEKNNKEKNIKKQKSKDKSKIQVKGKTQQKQTKQKRDNIEKVQAKKTEEIDIKSKIDIKSEKNIIKNDTKQSKQKKQSKQSNRKTETKEKTNKQQKQKAQIKQKVQPKQRIKSIKSNKDEKQDNNNKQKNNDNSVNNQKSEANKNQAKQKQKIQANRDNQQNKNQQKDNTNNNNTIKQEAPKNQTPSNPNIPPPRNKET